jgi:phosphate-selective porin O/P
MGGFRRVRVWVCGLVIGMVLGPGQLASAGQLEDLLLENKQITIDQWVKLKAEEEKREAKAMEESRGVGDVPVRERWYEKISIRGFAQFRQNYSINNDFLNNNQGDKSIGQNNSFYVRRARLIVSGQPHERVFFYIQPEFAGTFQGNNEQAVTLRDFYADLFLTENKEWRIRAGQSKVPFGFENMQSSQNRLALDRTDAINSAALNERDIGLFLYYAPTSIRERFRRLVESGLKGSGDYGMLGVGVYNGQGTGTFDLNKGKHIVFHSMYPHEFSNGQVLEVGMDAYTGQYTVSTAQVAITDFNNPSVINPLRIPLTTNQGNYLDERVTWHVVLYPQPFGFQAEYNIGRGPALSTDRTQVQLDSLRGGYLQFYYNYKCDSLCVNIFPFLRVQEYFGGKKFEANAPRYSVREWDVGLEYQFNRALELTVEYVWAQRTSSNANVVPASCVQPPGNPIVCSQTPYQLQTGNLLRFQLQWNF